MNKILKEASQKMGYYYVLPAGEKTLPISGSTGFIRDMREMLDLMTHSPTALKILYHNANLKQPLVIEEFPDALDFGRNTGESIQVAYRQKKDGEKVSKYHWLTLVPHEFRHSYNMPKSESLILHGIAYAVTNELDAHAIEGLITLELCDYLKKSNNPEADAIQEHLLAHREHKEFQEIYEKTQGTETERKAETMMQFIPWLSRFYIPRFKKTFVEQAYQTAIERDTTKDGWIECSDEDFEKIEACLLGKIKYEEIAHEPFMKGRVPLSDEREMIRREWPTFCKRLMDGTYNTDVFPYGQNVKPEELIETVSPKLAVHLREIGVMPKKEKPYLPTPVAER